MIAPFVFAATLLAQQPSQPPSPSGRGQSTQQQEPTRKIETQAPVNQSVPQQDTPPPNVQVPPINQISIQQTNGKEENATTQDLAPWILGLLTVGVGVLQWRVMRRQGDIAEQQNGIIRSQNSLLDATRKAAEDSVSAAQNSVSAAKDSLATNKEIERAYIIISHRDIQVVYDATGTPPPPIGIKFTVVIKNRGRTPGDILGGFYGYHIGQTPALPDNRSHLVGAFLLPDGHMQMLFSIQEDRNVLQRIMAGEQRSRLWLIGQVDYADRFGIAHRGGYARCLNHEGPAFSFVAETGPWNYDRPLTQEEDQHYGRQP
jgi:hypothetical protein